MKVRLTILTENDAKVPDGITEDDIKKVKNVWQAIFNSLCLFSEKEEKATVEKVEIINEEN